MQLNDGWSTRRLTGVLCALVAAAILVPVGVEAGGITLVRLQDGDSTAKAQVDGGRLVVGDKNGGPMTVDGEVGLDEKVSSTDAGVLLRGDCDDTDEGELTNLQTLASGKTVTGIVLTNDATGTSRTTLFATAPSVPGYVANPTSNTERAAGRFMALQVGFQSGGYSDFNESVTYEDGVKTTEVWRFYCTGVLNSAQGDGLWTVYGY